MKRFQHSRQIIQYQKEDTIGNATIFEEVVEWDDSNAIHRLTFRGPKACIETLIEELNCDSQHYSEVKSNGTTSITYEGLAALDVNSAWCSLNLQPLGKQKETSFIVTNDWGEQETVLARRSCSFSADGRYEIQGECYYWTESNYSVKPIAYDKFEIKGITYKSDHIVIPP